MKHLKKLTIVMATLAALALVAGTAFATNIPIANSDFETGTNSGFTSAYTYHALAVTDPDSGYGVPLGLYEEGYYTVGTDPKLFHISWADFGAFSGTQMMIVNGDTQPSVNVWASPTLVPVTAGVTYYFSAWLTSVYPSTGSAPIAPATLAFSINGTQLDGNFQLSSAVGTWQQFYQPWVAPVSGIAYLSLINKNTIAAGNDFALDDVALSTTIPGVPEPATMLLLGLGLIGVAGIRRKFKSSKS